MVKKAIGYMGIDMRWIRSYTEIEATIQGSVPIKGELIVDPRDSNVIVKYDQPQERVHLITAKVEPCKVIVYIPSSLQQLQFECEKSAINSRENVSSVIRLEVHRISYCIHLVMLMLTLSRRNRTNF